jgi:DNA helicase-2/ATP-dependent DNA helicase PcrA
VNLLSYNRQRVPKEIDSPSGMPEPPVGQGLVVLRAGDDPLGATCEQVALLTGQHPASQVAVLCRVNASLAPVQVALVHRGVPVRPAVDVSYLQRGGVQAALAWLRLAVAQDGGLAGRDLMLAARRPSRSMSPRLVSWIGERNDLNGLLRMVDRMQDRDRGKLEEYISDVQAVRRAAAGGDTVDVLRLVRDSIGLDKAMLLLEGSRRRLDRSAQTDDLDALVALAGLHPDPGGFESWLAQSLSDPGTPDGVVLSTVHRVKGQEWPFVVLHDVSEGLLPHRLASDVEEERRVFHVGLTRAINTSWVVAGSRPSRFVDELGRMCPPGYQPQQSVTPVRESSQRAVSGPAGRGGHGPMPNTDVAARLAAFAQGTQLAVPDATTERIKQALRSWRTQQATKSGKPPYIYLYDRTIEQMAQQAPETMAQLARIDGIGPAKLESYGEQLLEIIGQAASS